LREINCCIDNRKLQVATMTVRMLIKRQHECLKDYCGDSKAINNP